MSFLKKIFINSLAAVTALAVLPSCIDENLAPCPDNPGSGGGAIASEEYMLQFKISLKSLSEGSRSRAGSTLDESYEDYIDPSKLYVMFFLKNEDAPSGAAVSDNEDDEADYYLYRMFEPLDKKVSLIPIDFDYSSPNNSGKFDKNWYVRIAVSEMTDAKEFAETLRNRDFKIAVIANAESGKSIDITQATKTGDILTLGSNINLLHHQTGSDDPFNNNVFSFLWSGNRNNANGKVMGYYSDWVKNNSENYDTETKAFNWIRGNWDPDPASDNIPGYSDLWLLWNFSADYSGFSGNENAVNWAESNGNDLKTWITAADAEEDKVLPNFTTDENVPLSLRNFTSGNKATAVVNGNECGVLLPQHNTAGGPRSSYTKLRSSGVGCLTFRAPASGTLLIKAKSAEPGTSAKVIAQLGYSENIKEFVFNENTSEVRAKIINDNCGITTQGALPVYIFTDKDSEAAAIFYQIEFVQDSYLAATDRVGVTPEEQPIPMYGIEKFDKLTPWIPGTTFDLNDYHNINGETTYKHKPIPLLRSVAKVEVQIPTVFHAHSVYLRNSNRLARWEPSDVRSNTLTYWTDDHLSFQEAPEADEYCEWFYMFKQPTFFDDAGGNNYPDYQEKVAWYYGDWKNKGFFTGVTPVGTADDRNNFDYPHIMNPVYSVNDFVAFLPAAPVEGSAGNDRYVLYVGEKFNEDPDNLENLRNALPKVCHIEFRVEDDPTSNLDDDNCFRIYFADNGFYSTTGEIPNCKDEANTWEKKYEQISDNLQGHWPIMRNHHYKFTVKDIRANKVVVQLEVLPWAKNSDINVVW